jgi:peptide/nickel transport system permease protein
MIWFVAKTVLGAAFKLLVAAAIIFFALDLVSGETLGLGAANGRFWHWIGSVLGGGFGTSKALGQPVGGLILERLAVTAPLLGLALIMAGALGVGLGYVAGRNNRAIAGAIASAGKGLAAVPGLWLALMLVLIFGTLLRWLPAGGFVAWSNPPMSIVSLLLPAFALALPTGGTIAAALCEATAEARGAAYFRAALARGAGAEQAFRRHALPNIVVRVLDQAGPSLMLMLPASVIVETVFYLPGLGRLLLDAATARDAAVVEAGLLVVILGLLLVAIALKVGRAVVDQRAWRRTAP